jgi:hypothetical protein
MKKILHALLGLAAIVTFNSCSTTSESTTSESYVEGVPGRTIRETYKMTAEVDSVDRANRTVTLDTHDGKQTIKCGPEVRNFDQIHEGDHVKVEAMTELAVAMADASDTSAPVGAGVVAVAARGAQPAAAMAETQEYLATVTDIDLNAHKATILLPDGRSRKFPVRKDVDLTKRSVGEKVRIRVTMAMAVAVEKD